MKKRDVLLKLGWTEPQMQAFFEGTLPETPKDLCFAHRFCPSLRQEIERKLKHVCCCSLDAWIELTYLDPVLPFSEIHQFILDQILPLLDNTIDIIETMCRLQMRTDEIEHHPWSRAAYSKAISLAVTLEDWVKLWHHSYDDDVAAHAEEVIEKLCQTKEDWEEFLRLADEIEVVDPSQLYNKALKNAGREDEIDELSTGETELDNKDDEIQQSSSFRPINANPPSVSSADWESSFRQLQTYVTLLLSEGSKPKLIETARSWIASCDLPFGAFYAIISKLQVPKDPFARAVASIFSGHGVFELLVRKLIETAQTVEDCVIALQYASYDLSLEWRISALARTLDDWVLVWKAAKRSPNLQQVALTRALQFATDD